MNACFSFLPNFLTLIRLFLMMPVGYSVIRGYFGIALGLFLFAAVSDLVDGWLARRYAWETSLGKFLDPLADKLLLLVALVALMFADVLPYWAGIALLGRDLALMVAAGIYRHLVGYLNLAPSFFGKTCVAAIMVLIAMLLFTQVQVPYLSEIARWCVEFGLVLIVVTLSLASLVEYLWSYGTHGVALLRARGR